MRAINNFILLFFMCGIFLGMAQGPRPMHVSSNSGATFTKDGEMDYTVRDASGRILTNVMDLKFLGTETLSVLDKANRTIYLLEDFEVKSVGASGTAKVLSTNIDKDFYITNPNSFAFFLQDRYVSGGDFVNIKSSYVYYLPDNNTTYFLEGIRSFPDWGAKSAEMLPYNASNTYWTRDATNNTYHVIVKGKAAEYKTLSSEKSGNDLIVKQNGIKKYKLPGYYTTASYVYKPVEMVSGNSSVGNNSSGSGCVSGNCQDGWGKQQLEGGYYEGFWENGKKEGYGMYKWEGTGKYIGSWKNDQMQGYGTYIADNEDNIVGWYSNGQLNGTGYTVTGGKWEQGVYTNGELTTPYTFITNKIDSGCTAGDCKNKYGRYKWDNGDSFTGFWKNGSMYMGTYTFASGDKYSGTFNNNNQFDGFGRYFYKDGGYYGGEWKNGNYEGKGYYHNKDYERQIGIWRNSSLVNNLN
ncbi:MORN repeat-containing protein [Marinirhabdus gelatinilytica]|uniref:MORN repeat protein n=1 Tax=Marinirhabdus gelatinilytica TaxID=1703343 RepID=A0A370QLH9_9FLAO|nr:hypothetical protein [Marinirhabdus gelatinilytica]RDK89237.1 hypothetical protein C8D94_1011118 [Marinirhabdus gelatinilytica]